jgi:hypothetical protein
MTQEKKDKLVIGALLGSLLFNLIVLIICEFHTGY